MIAHASRNFLFPSSLWQQSWRAVPLRLRLRNPPRPLMRCILPRRKPWRGCPLRQRLLHNFQRLLHFPFPMQLRVRLWSIHLHPSPHFHPCLSAAVIQLLLLGMSHIPMARLFPSAARSQRSGDSKIPVRAHGPLPMLSFM